ncbi:MAG: filamentous hemagglutinin N-terminal domain-containing protein [Methylocystis sp.]|nr:filamentous hemagglutinin N-terminal domain-containing protein [Methylocystis sp.]
MRDMMRFSKILLATTALVAVGSLALRAQAQTLPTGGSVAAGQVAIGAPNAGRMAITQGSQNAIVNWQGFSIGQGGRVDITQPNSSAAMLNRVTGQAPSTIAGQLNANGQVFLVNPNGIAITNSGVVNTGSFVASTLGISDGDFLAGRLRFQGNGTSAAVSNAGSIQAAPGGYAALLGGRVDNSGTISVPLGRIGLGAGERVTLDLSGDGFLQVAVPSAVGGDQALVSNSGRLSAPGGRVEMAAATAQAAARHAINMSGVVEANAVSGQAGSITFSGGPGGTVTVSGRVNASSATGRGGNVTVTGANIALRGAQVDASGATGGGRVRIGGDRLGQGDLPRAQRVSVDNASVIRADATTRGDGGDIVLWSEGRTDFAGSISARGGAEGGRGGEAEVSSRGVLNYTGWTDLRAPLGAWGTLLLDPYNITISNGTQTNPGFTATTEDSVINAGTLITALGGANVVVFTGTAGTQAGNITLEVPLSWSSAGNLTLQAAGGIALNGAVTAAAGGLTLQAGSSSTISATEAISVGRFELLSGNWVQNTATLPSFAATDFRIPGGSFLRAAGGAGTTASPYLLTDIYGVQGMGSSATLLGSSYRLANDIAASGTSAWNGGAGFVPVGTLGARFNGSLDGARHVINGLTINRRGTDFVGLIGAAHVGSSISNLGLVGASVRGRNFVGGLVGVGAGSITQVYATGEVTGNIRVGGLAGDNDIGGTISQSYASVTVEGDIISGGLVGLNFGTITQAYATGGVTGSSNVGGLVGVNNSGTVTQSYWDTQTTGQGSSAGGTGLTTAQARTQASYGVWDFANVWYQAGDMRPILRSEAAAPVGGVTTIRNLNQLQLMGANLAGNYRLAGNIDASASNSSDSSRSIWGSGGFVPVGASATPFTGSLNGAGYVINGLTIDRPMQSEVGLIGATDNGSSITNLGLVGSVVKGSGAVGGLVGSNNGNITRSYVTGVVTGASSIGGLVGWNLGGSITESYAAVAVNGSGVSVGGLVGRNHGSIAQSYATGAVIGDSFGVGGLVGRNNGSITQSYATGAVTGGSNDVGGLVGANNGTIAQAYATGAVMGTGDDVGGLVGYNNLGRDISETFATGTVKGRNYVGGLVGLNDGGSVFRSYATGAVEGINNVGGLLGHNGGSITQAYATGRVTGSLNVGGLVGQNFGTITQSYWDTETTGRATSAGGTGLTTAEARTQTSYEGWGFATVWYQAGDMRPILRSEAAAPVNGVITIRNLNQLQLMGANLAGSYRLAGDIDATPTSGSNAAGIWGSGGFVPVGTNAARFTGSLDGAGHVINGLMINRGESDFVGLIGLAGTDSSISNLGLVNGSVRGSSSVGGLVGFNSGNITRSYAIGGEIFGDSFVGGLVGRLSNGTIEQSYATGRVEGRSAVGGLAGVIEGSGRIKQSYASGAVSGTENLGGLAGYMTSGRIEEAYATGAVTGINAVGGLVGIFDGGRIEKAYATGVVTGQMVAGGLVASSEAGIIAQSYWDTQSTGQSGSAGGTGLTTAQMQDITSFRTTYAGWDFDNVWSPPNQVGQNNGSATAYYPQLYSLSPAVAVTAGLSFSSREYGDSNPTASFTTAGLRAGDSIATQASLTGLPGTDANIGTYQLSGTGAVLNTPSGTTYRLIYVPSALSITPRLITVTPDSGQSREYGDANPTLSYGSIARTTPGASGDALLPGASITGALGTVATLSSDVGLYDFTLGTVSAGANYSITVAPTPQFQVTPRLITVTPDSGQSREYGDANPVLSYALSRTTTGASGAALVNGNTLSGALASAADGTSNVGSYAISQGDLAANSNYTLSFTSGRTMAVTPRLITVRANDLARDYGQPNPSLTYSISSGGLVNGDRFTGSLFTSAGLQSEAGSYVISQGSLSLSANYAMSFVPGTLTVRRAAAVSSDGVGSTTIAWMSQNGQLFWLHRGHMQFPWSMTDRSFGTPFMIRMLSSGGLNAE